MYFRRTMLDAFENRQPKDVKPNMKDTKAEPAFVNATKITMKDDKTDIGSSGEMKSTQNDKISPTETHPSTPTAASEVKTYTLTNILDLARSTAEMDFTTPELRDLILDMEAWLARVKSEVERKQRRGMQDKGEAKTRADFGQRQMGHLLLLAEIGSIIHRLEERLRRRERFGGELRFKETRVRKRVKGLLGSMKGRLSCEKDEGSGRDGI